MLVQISHERSQALLRQRNLFALSSAGLAIALVVAGGLAATRNREVVLVPTTRAALTISSAGVSAQYMEFVTRDAALMLLNRSPEGLDYWMEQILELADPAEGGKLKADLVRIVGEQRGSDVTQAFVIKEMKVDPSGLTSEVKGKRGRERVARVGELVVSRLGVAGSLGAAVADRAGLGCAIGETRRDCPLGELAGHHV